MRTPEKDNQIALSRTLTIFFLKKGRANMQVWTIGRLELFLLPSLPSYLRKLKFSRIMQAVFYDLPREIVS